MRAPSQFEKVNENRNKQIKKEKYLLQQMNLSTEDEFTIKREKNAF